MPIEHFVDAEGILRVRRWGSISTQDEDRAFAERKQDPKVVPGIPVLVDCTEVSPPDSTDIVKYLADRSTHIAKELLCGPVAIYVSSDVEYGMARMYMAYTDLEHPDTEVFRSRAEAENWLRDHHARHGAPSR